MNFFNSSISPKFPFRDSFQNCIEKKTRDFFQEKYGTFKTLNRKKFFNDMIKIEEKCTIDAGVTAGPAATASQSSRLIRVEIRAVGPKISLKSYPLELVDEFTKKGDFRIKEGIVGPLLRSLVWANKNNIDIPPKLEVDMYFWIADKPSWDIDNLPIFIPAAIPPTMNLPLFPDISYFYYQPSAKYVGKGLIWDETKKLFEGPNEDLEDILYFRGCDTTKFNSNIRGEISKCLSKYIDKKNLDITVFNVNDTSKFRALHEEGKGKNFLELPGKFPWSNRIKMLFLFEGSPTIIKVNERWIASDESWCDPEDPWIQWIDGFLPRNTYLEVMHTHTQIVKTDRRGPTKALETINRNAIQDTLECIANVYSRREELRPDKELGHSIVTELTSDRINQFLFRLILTMNHLNKDSS